MNRKIVDVVNFNADASCLSSRNWLQFISGGNESILFQWLELYVRYNKKVILGFPAATIADIVTFNHDAIELINSHPNIFEIILRPFTHDITLLRTREGFNLNLQLGIEATTKEFSNVRHYYLPPEFMCNSTQISLLIENNIKGTFINSARFDKDVARRIPTIPFNLRGLLGSKLPCIPFDSQWTAAYLSSIHTFNCEPWHSCLSNAIDVPVSFVWRDGESSFLLPDTVRREETWLSQENSQIERYHLGELDLPVADYEPFQNGGYLSTYPVHSFSAWIREMKMYWYVFKVQKLEEQLSDLSPEQQSIWLQLINSDILSAVEKRSPTIQLLAKPDSREIIDYTIYRKDKGFEGEEYLQILEHFDESYTQDYFLTSDAPHIIKLRNRLAYISQLQVSSSA